MTKGGPFLADLRSCLACFFKTLLTFLSPPAFNLVAVKLRFHKPLVMRKRKKRMIMNESWPTRETVGQFKGPP